jgi:hypothetical protein
MRPGGSWDGKAGTGETRAGIGNSAMLIPSSRVASNPGRTGFLQADSSREFQE